MDAVVLCIWGLWLLLSILVYVPKLNQFVRSLDAFSLIPEWKFFAPNPGQGDFHLLWRDRLADGCLTDWTEAAVAGDRSMLDLLWNPGKRGRKALFDAIMELAAHARDGPHLPIEGSIPYLAILNYVSQRPRFFGHCATQFLVMYGHGTGAADVPDVVVQSAFHTLETSGETGVADYESAAG